MTMVLVEDQPKANGIIIFEVTTHNFGLSEGPDPQLIFSETKDIPKAARKKINSMKVLGEKLLQLEAQIGALSELCQNGNVVKTAYLFAQGFPLIYQQSLPINQQPFMGFMDQLFQLRVPYVDKLPSSADQCPLACKDERPFEEQSILTDRIFFELPKLFKFQFHAKVNIVSIESNCRNEILKSYQMPALLQRFMAALHIDGIKRLKTVEYNMVIKAFCSDWPAVQLSILPTKQAKPEAASAEDGDPGRCDRTEPASSKDDTAYTRMECLVKECLPSLYQLYQAGKVLLYMTGRLKDDVPRP